MWSIFLWWSQINDIQKMLALQNKLQSNQIDMKGVIQEYQETQRTAEVSEKKQAFVYNIFNWFRRVVLSAKMRKQRIDTVHLKLLKIATKAVRSARYITFKLCSSCPYKEEFYDTLSAIGKLNVQLE